MHGHMNVKFFYAVDETLYMGVPGGMCETSGECSLC